MIIAREWIQRRGNRFTLSFVIAFAIFYAIMCSVFQTSTLACPLSKNRTHGVEDEAGVKRLTHQLIIEATAKKLQSCSHPDRFAWKEATSQEIESFHPYDRQTDDAKG